MSDSTPSATLASPAGRPTLGAMRRRGFTLTEMLVATAVFAVGFVGVFGLFLAGIRFRKMSDDLTKCSLAASSLVAEIRIDAGREGGTTPMLPSDYVGDGFAAAPDGAADELYPYPAMPGMWYRVLSCTDALPAPGPAGGDKVPDDAAATAIRLRLVVVPFGTADATLTLTEIGRRLQVPATDPDGIADELHRRSVALVTDAVITRQPSWAGP